MTNSRNHVILQPAYVLHSTPYRDTSVLLEVFTPDHGRIGLVARGVRSAKSRLRGVLQPFRPLLISWYSKGDLGTLTTAELQVEKGDTNTRLGGSCASCDVHGSTSVAVGGRTEKSDRSPYLGVLPGAERALMSGFYLNELLLRLLHRHDPHPALFHSYDLALRKLVLEDDVILQQALRIFEKELLQDIGYGLVLDRDVITGEPVTAEGMYRYHLEKGPERMGCISAAHIANTLGIVLHGHTLLGLAHNELARSDVLYEAKRLLRKILAVHLGQQPLRSRELYNEMLAVIST